MKQPTPAESEAGASLAAIRHGPRCTVAQSKAVADALIALHGSITKAARATGLSRQTIDYWRSGKNTAPLAMFDIIEQPQKLNA